jgi:hypothetical protein
MDNLALSRGLDRRLTVVASSQRQEKAREKFSAENPT